MYWADKIAKQIIESGKYKSNLSLRGKPYWVDDMKTPSGFAHVGSLRGPIIHSLIFRALKDAGVKAKFTFVINDFDPADELPPEFKKELKEYLGFPLRKVPSPEKVFDSLGGLLAGDFVKTFQSLGVEAEILSSWDMYHEGKFDVVIKEALDNAVRIQDIYKKVSGSQKKEKGWFPFEAICEKCGKIGTTHTFAWNGKEVSYKCEPEMVVWARGCGYEGRTSPFGGTGKLPWKVDWAAHWKVMGVTVEGAGKDHASAGGSYDIAMALCKEVFHYPQPYKLPYEFFLIGGKKMSSSKGLGLKAHDIIKILPPEIARFLFARTDYREAIDFEPVGTAVIPDLFDEFDKARQAYIKGSEEELARAFVLAQIKDLPPKKEVFLPRFREVAQTIQMPNVDINEYFKNKKCQDLTNEENEILAERIKYAKIWVEEFAPDDAKFQIASSVRSAKTRRILPASFYQKLSVLIESVSSPEELEKKLYQLIKEQNLSPKTAFGGIYSIMIGKNYGPKAAWFIWENKEKAIKLFRGMAK